MSELSPDARDLVAQARRQGPALLGPTAAQRAALRERLAPAWARGSQPTAASKLRWRAGLSVLLTGLGLLGWLVARSQLTPAEPAPQRAAPLEQLHGRQPTSPSLAVGAQTSAGPAEPPLPAADTNTDTNTEAEARPADPPRPIHPAQPLKMAARTRPNRNPSRPTRPPAAVVTGSSETAVTAAPAPSEPRSTRATTTPGALAQYSKAEPLRAPHPRAAPRTGERGAPSRTLGTTDTQTAQRAVQTIDAPGPSSIDGELELLGSAQTALQKKRPSRALTLLQQHAFRFPTGAMVEERMAMQALALCALQRRSAARAVLSDLAARGPQSQLLPRVRAQCGL